MRQIDFLGRPDSHVACQEGQDQRGGVRRTEGGEGEVPTGSTDLSQ
jgi:hypothetical protein